MIHLGYAVPARYLDLSVLGPQDLADGHWLAGLTDGEGCFFMSTRRTRTVRGYGYKRFRVLTFTFKIALRADDRATLERARTHLGVGNLGINRRGGRATSGNAKPLGQLVVSAREDLRRIVDVFRAFPLRSKKARDFALWAHAVERLEEQTRATPLTWVSQGKLDRPAIGERRPLAGATRQRFRRIPDELFTEMSRYAEELRNGRVYA